MPLPGPITPACPRCGYDQSGAAAAWEDRCPVEGTCPECGHRFSWADLFDPGRRDLPWYAEHAPGLLGVVRRTPRTLLRLARPALFWREVGVDAPVRIGRLVWFVLFLGVGGHLAVAAALFTHDYRKTTASNGSFLSRRAWRNAYSNDDAVNAAFESLFDPILHLYANGWGNASGALRIGSVSFGGWRVPWHLAMVVGATFLWAVVIAVLPTTRRAFTVRRAHVFRAALLSLLAPLLALEFVRALTCVNRLWIGSPVFRPLWRIGVPLFNLALTAWVLRWWWCAVRVGWRLRPTVLILCLGTAAAVLGACVFALLLDMRGLVRAAVFG